MFLIFIYLAQWWLYFSISFRLLAFRFIYYSFLNSNTIHRTVLEEEKNIKIPQ
jgi:hypothetical protein